MDNKKLMVLCGDSFNYGIGCVNQYSQPYGVLTSNYFNWDLVRLARGSASNYVVHLQGCYAATMRPKPHLVILGTTSIDRLEWLATGTSFNKARPCLENVNYHDYPPHHEPQPLHDAPMDYYLRDNPKYDPKILSEQMGALPDYIHHVKTKGVLLDYYRRLRSESIEKLELINRYYFDIVDSGIKRDYDVGVISLAYRRIKKQNINCIIVSDDPDYKFLVDNEGDLFLPDWGRCTATWPDSVGSLHAGEGGHADIAERLIKHIQQYKLS